MPPIASRTGAELSGYSPIVVPPASTSQLEQPLLPVRDSKLRFSAPNIPGAFPSSDTLIGYHLGGMLPQWRIPVPPTVNSGSSSTSTATVVTSSGGSTTTVTSPKAQMASTVTSVLSPGSSYTGVILLAKSAEIQTITVNAPARIRLYSTAANQASDLTRPITQGLGYGTGQGLIADIVMETAPVVWAMTPIPTAANGDSPQSNALYLTVNNLGAASTTFNISISYVPMQS